MAMPATNYAIQAYREVSSYKAQRDVEADIFQQVINTLRAARGAGVVQRVKAIADNRRLWMTVQTVITDPGNVLPEVLRASIVSLGLTVQRETNSDDPDIDFMISINETVAGGLSHL